MTFSKYVHGEATNTNDFVLKRQHHKKWSRAWWTDGYVLNLVWGKGRF